MSGVASDALHNEHHLLLCIAAQSYIAVGLLLLWVCVDANWDCAVGHWFRYMATTTTHRLRTAQKALRLSLATALQYLIVPTFL